MNLLVFGTEELGEDGLLLVHAERAAHLREILGVLPGKFVRVGQIGAGVGLAEVIAVDGQTVTLQVGVLGSLPSRPPVDLIVAMPRPQTLKKVLETAATMGVGELSLIGTRNVEKSYFSSPMLKEKNLRHHLRLGMEQGMTTWCPTVKIYRRFPEFLDAVLPDLAPNWSHKLLAHPSGTTLENNFPENVPIGDRRVCCAIGPERGWAPGEIDAFLGVGFQTAAISNRILRVETAVCAVLAQLEVLSRTCGRQTRAETQCSVRDSQTEFHVES